MYGGAYNYQGGEGYDPMQMQDQNFGFNPQMADPYYQQAAMQGGGMFDANGYPIQQPGIMYDANGYPIQQPMVYDANGYPMQQGYDGQQDAYGAEEGQQYDAEQTEAPVAAERGSFYDGPDAEYRSDSDAPRKKKSFCGPPEGSKSFARTRSTKGDPAQKSSKGGLARNGSVFQIKSERDTQRSVSTRGTFTGNGSTVDDEELEMYYGDMAKRRGDQRFDGFKAMKSYRGEIRDGEDVGKPRRVIGARSLQGKGSTGYGGLNFKRQCAMRNGESWGDIEVRRKANAEPAPKARSRALAMPEPEDDDDDAARRAWEEERRRREMMMMMQPPMMMPPPMMMEQPAVPRVYNQEDVHSYSNLSDAFSNDQIEDEDDDS